MTTRCTPASPVPSPIGKARQVDRVVKALEQRQESLARAAAAPVHRQRRVATRHEQLHLAHRAALASTMDVHHRREFLLRLLRKSIHRRHPRRLAFERADEIPHMAKHRAVLLPLADHLDLQRVLLRIKIGP